MEGDVGRFNRLSANPPLNSAAVVKNEPAFRTASYASSHFSRDSEYSVSPCENETDVVTPSCELFGSLVGVREYHVSLSQVDDLRDSALVDELMGLVETLTTCSSRKSMRKHMVRVIALKHQILDKCTNLLNRARVIEIIEDFKVNSAAQHFNYWYKSIVNPRSTCDIQRQVLNQLQPFKQLCKAIPSITHRQDLIDHLCLEFANQSLYTRRTEREEKYIDFLGISGQLQEMCQTEEDRRKLMLAMEVARESNRKFIDEYSFVNRAESDEGST
ncbi:hypothetical protein HDU98_008979 [Podochytrium sp. JEL0797]|nr:hypothetical protein HDU98_008979 [Podochytrium sp. JEL0797]